MMNLVQFLDEAVHYADEIVVLLRHLPVLIRDYGGFIGLTLLQTSRRYPSRSFRYLIPFTIMRRLARLAGRPLAIAEIGVGTGQMKRFADSMHRVAGSDTPLYSKWLAFTETHSAQSADAGYDSVEVFKDDSLPDLEGMDCILVLQILEQLRTPEEFLERLVAGLPEGAVLIGSLPSTHPASASTERESGDPAPVFTVSRLSKLGERLGVEHRLMTGHSLFRRSGSWLENRYAYARANLAISRLIPSWSTEVTFVWVKRPASRRNPPKPGRIIPTAKGTEPFPSHLLLEEPGRALKLLGEFYRQHHERRNYAKARDAARKAVFFRDYLQAKLNESGAVGLDLGCRGGALTREVGVVRWYGVDVDPEAVERANANGIPCVQKDIALAVDFQSDAFDAVMMTEVMEHLSHPVITVREVYRVLRKEKASAFMGSVPLDYHLHRRWKVMRGKRLSGDPTHIHHFSFTELDHLLRFYFAKVEYLPLAGVAARHPRLRLPLRHFVRDIAWIASAPKKEVPLWDIREVL